MRRRKKGSDNDDSKNCMLKWWKIYRISCFILKRKMLNFLVTKPAYWCKLPTPLSTFFSILPAHFCVSSAGTHFHWPHFIKLNYFTRNALVNSSNWKVIRAKTLKQRRRPLFPFFLFNFLRLFPRHASHSLPLPPPQHDSVWMCLKRGHDFKRNILTDNQMACIQCNCGKY